MQSLNDAFIIHFKNMIDSILKIQYISANRN